MLKPIIILIYLCILILILLVRIYIRKPKEKTYTQDEKDLINCVITTMTQYCNEELISIHRFGITSIEYDFKEDHVDITFNTATPGMLIGKGGSTIDSISSLLRRATHNFKYRVNKINIKENCIWKRI